MFSAARVCVQRTTRLRARPRFAKRHASVESTSAVSDGPIAFSKTPAKFITRDPMLGDHERNSSPRTIAVIVTIGVLFCSAIIYSGATQSVNLKEIITPDELVMEQFQKVKAKAEKEL